MAERPRFNRRFHIGRFRQDLSRQIRDEIRFYLEMRTEELIDQGVPPEQAWRQALDAFGDPKDIERRARREAGVGKGRRRGLLMGSIVQDIRFALRTLASDSGFTLVAILTLALGIGANTAIFSVVEAALFRSPPVREPESLVAVYTTSRRGFPRSSSSYLDYLDYRDRSTHLVDMAASSGVSAALGDDDLGARFVTIEAASGNFFELLGIMPAVGRLIQPQDDRLKAGAKVLVLSHALWEDHFQGDPDIVGRTVRLNGAPFTVVGVVPEAFTGLTLDVRPDLWIPLQSGVHLGTGGSIADPRVWDARGNRWIGRLVARLRPGSTVEQARAEMLAISAQLAEEDPQARGPRSVTVDRMSNYLLPLGSEAQLTRFTWLLMGIVGLTLLLACANVANLLLARGSTRAREIGVRLALGAGRRRLMGQLLTECLVLAALGGMAGLAVAVVILELLGSAQLPGGLAIDLLGIELSGGMLAITALVSIATGLVFGLMPALHATRPDLVGALKGDSAHSGPGHGLGIRKSLVAAQLALCLVLLAGSGLFLRTLQRSLAFDLGFDTETVAIARLPVHLMQYAPEEAVAFTKTLRDRVRALPGVTDAALSTRVPLQLGGQIGTFFEVDGYVARADEELRTDLVFVTPGYFASLGLSILQGRAFNESDGASAVPVTVISRRVAETYWPNGDAVGGTVRVNDRPVEVIGVVDDATWARMGESVTNYMFATFGPFSGQAARSFLTLSARTTGDPSALLPLLRSEVEELVPDLPITLLRTMDQQVAGILSTPRMGATLLSAFGLLALVLAGVGIAGVVAFAVNRQRRDIGVRVALGAAKSDVIALVARGMAGPILLGLAGGLVLASVLARTVSGFLFEVSALDPITFVGISLGLALLAVVATLVPARRATRVDPIEVLKSD